MGRPWLPRLFPKRGGSLVSSARYLSLMKFGDLFIKWTLHKSNIYTVYMYMKHLHKLQLKTNTSVTCKPLCHTHVINMNFLKWHNGSIYCTCKMETTHEIQSRISFVLVLARAKLRHMVPVLGVRFLTCSKKIRLELLALIFNQWTLGRQNHLQTCSE